LRLSIILSLLLGVTALHAADPKPATLQVFNSYVRQAEDRISREQQSPQTFLHDPIAAPERESRLRHGDVLIDRVGVKDIEGGMIHHWIGTVLLPRATIPQVLSIVHDYNHLPQHYAPKVIDSRLFTHHGDDYQFRMRTREHKVITVVLDVDYDVRDSSPHPGYWSSTSRSTRVAEVQDAGTSHEHDLAPADAHGFLWAINTYWRFVQIGDSVIVQCEAISLSRDIPTGLGWLLRPYIQSVPRESLEFTLAATRKAVLAQNTQPQAQVKR